jgi:hypothetical protein
LDPVVEPALQTNVLAFNALRPKTSSRSKPVVVDEEQMLLFG